MALQIFYNQAMSYALTGRGYWFSAYVLRSDGAYVNVTSAATWQSSDPQILRTQSTAGLFEGVSAGRVDITAQYQSLSASLSLPVVRSDRLVYPRLEVSGGDPHTVGTMTSIQLTYLPAQFSGSQQVSNLVTWTSASPSIVRVNGNAVTAVQVGTTVLSTTYNGLSVEYGVSVHPVR